MRRAALVGAGLALAGCGGDAGTPAASDRLVDLSAKPPLVNSLELDRGTGDLLLTTNRGFFRIDPDADSVQRQRATLTAGNQTASLGTFLELDAIDERTLVGSGHPDPGSRLPQYLGFIRSTDGGRRWEPVSRMGSADLYKIIRRHDRLYAWDAVLSAILISDDGGRTFTEHFTPRGVIADFEVDPGDPDRIVAATDEQLYRSTDGGDSWRPLLPRGGVRLAWPAPDRLYVAGADGGVQVSADGGDTYEDAGQIDGEPAVLKALSEEELLVALTDGTILRTTDGGARWEEEFRP